MTLNKSRLFSSIIVIFLLAGGLLAFFRYQIYFSHGTLQAEEIFEIKKGEGNAQIAEHLKKDGLISGKVYFYYYLRSHGLLNKILPGNYQLSGKMTIPEIGVSITEGKKEFVKITFPEGWTSKEMANRLEANGFSGKDFLSLVSNPPEELLNQFDFLGNSHKGKSLEGFLFPDTYFFSKDATLAGIVSKILNNFGLKLSSDLRQEIKNQDKDLSEIITMASIIEREVKTEEDRKIVSGIFWKRVNEGRGLQSCATLAFILGENKKQYSFADTRIQSPYNTYLYRGLPPGPISNPGLVSIKAAIYPTASDYNYFLSDPDTGKTIFSKTIEEHNANKVKYGL